MLKEYNLDKIYIRHAIDENPDDRDFTMHIHESCEIYFFVRGKIDYFVEGSQYPLKDRSIMIMRPSEVHKPRITGSGIYERFAVNFPVSFANEIDSENRLLKPFINRPLGENNLLDNSVIDIALVYKLFSDIFEANDDYKRLLTAKIRLLLLLDMIDNAYGKLNSSTYKPRSISESIVRYVNKHLFEEISVPDLAGNFYLSPSQFTRIFKRATGAPPREYILRKRLTAAKEKIHSGFTAQSAAESCGFKDYSSFYRAYKKYFGFSPSDV